jgi:DNA helicase IV
MVPTKNEAAEVHSALKKAGLAASIIGPNERDRADSKAARVATMHRAKGLEFDEVVLIIPISPTQITSGISDPQKLHYVAITRAKKMATVFRCR